MRSYYPMNMKVHNNKLYASFYQNRIFRYDLANVTVIGIHIYTVQEMYQLHKNFYMPQEMEVC